MKKLILFYFLFVSIRLFSQQYGNEWINYSQNYYKISVVSKGIHRISYTDLTNAGVPITKIDPLYLQLFFKGQEQYIYISGAADRSFDNNDYIEFYGEPNNGWLDTMFYLNPSQQVNRNYSLVNDTASYFLTWNSSGVTKRFIEENDVAFNSYTPLDYCLREVRQDYINNYNSTEEGSYYNDGEGYIDNSFDYGTTISKSLSTPNYISKSINSTISICLVGANSTGHHFQVTGPGILIDTSFYGYKTVNTSTTTPVKINATSTFNAKSISNGTLSTDKNAWAWASIIYTHSMDFENAKSFAFTLPKIAATKYRLDITDFNGDTSSVLYDLTNHKRIRPSNNSGTFQLLMKNEGNAPSCFISSGSDFKKVVSINAITSLNANQSLFADFSVLKVGYIIITNKLLWAKAQEYANYRKSKGFNVLLLDVDELYNQFGYGINKHPVAIRNFCRFALKYSSVKPEYLFLIGKSIHTKLLRNDPSVYAQCLVPSAGNPVSDELFTWRLGTGYSPILATGRIAALSLSDVDLYLNKVKEYEQWQPTPWMKNILQFAGGHDIGEESAMQSYIEGYQKIFQDTMFGANVQNYFKNSSQPIGTTQTDIIKQSINSGVSILNFFGHAAATGFDQNIDLPSTYDNKGKYPMLIANSCYSGDINNPGVQGVSEQWVLIKDKGTIGFLANVDVGYAFYLDLFSQELVKNISYKNYQGTIGKSILNAMQSNEKAYQSSSSMEFTSLDMNLHGDPAIKMNGFAKPDLIADVKYFSFKPAQLTTDIDSFKVNYLVVNQARAFADSFFVQIKRTFPNGKTTISQIKVHGIRSQDTISFKLPIGGISSVGMNRIDITLDNTDRIVELNEANNSASYSFLINSTDLLPIYPYKFAIFPNDTVTFLACSPDPYIKYKTAKCQLDVSAKFNSSGLITSAAQYVDGYFKCKMALRFTPNQVYYWRVAIDKGDGVLKWNTSSFIYIPGKTGWSQAQFYQFQDDDYKYLTWNEPTANFSFLQTPQRLFCRTIGSPQSSQWNMIEFTLDGSLQGWTSCGVEAAYNVAVFDSTTLACWQTNRNNFGQRNYPECSSAPGSPQNYFAFNTDAVSEAKMAQMLSDSVPKGDYILVFTWQTGNFGNMDEATIQKFEGLGAKQLRGLTQSGNNLPYIFYVKKGSPQSVQELVGVTTTSQIELNADLIANYNNGTIGSPVIGPSKHWAAFDQTMQIDSFDVNRFTITAINKKLQENVAMSQIQKNIDTLDKVVNSATYPFMRLSMSTRDQTLRTPGQLKSWQVYYDEYPEGAVSITSKSLFYADSVQEGDNVKMVISFKNISPYKMDSILVNYTFTDNSNQLIKLVTKRLKPLVAGELLTDSITFNTSGHVGKNLLTVEFNPFNPATGTYDQLEEYHFNNLAQKYFTVLKDKRNPLFDVMFDGIRIMNGDIVSAKPEIKISLKDENKFFILDDTSLVQVYLKSLVDNKEHRIQFSTNGGPGEMTFTPGTSKNNKAVITYTPIFTTDGMYQLRIQGKDKSGNVSGSSDYTIDFEIITKSSITNLINYPNPFTTSTRFVFTLTGSEIPTDLRIQIFTITGRMIKEISLGDIGSLHIGRNITQYAWNGTDNFGDKLANGVYLYRVFSSINGTEIEHRGADIDQYFKKGFGKMYLMR
jgi:hypothetical protein